MIRKLNKNQQLFCEEYVNNGFKARDAYRVAYPEQNDNTVATEPYRLLKDGRIIDYIKRLQFDYIIEGINVGVTRTTIVQKIKELLDAKKPITSQGNIIGESPDYIAITNGVNLWAKLVGDFTPEKKEILLDVNDDVDISKLDNKQLEELKQQLLASM